jgi:hypothetical protein
MNSGAFGLLLFLDFEFVNVNVFITFHKYRKTGGTDHQERKI